MGISALDIVREETRQASYNDGNYKERGKHLFVLRGPPNEGPLGPTGRAQFPLVINPDTFDYRLPFAAQATPQQEGGVVVEEDGIVVGSLMLEGTMGFKLRNNFGEQSFGRGDGDFSGVLDPGVPLTTGFVGGDNTSAGVSGHMHLWRLVTRCFDGYSALKKIPRIAAQVSMEYHNLKDDLHLRIVPQEFQIKRSADRERVTARYSIRADVVGPARDDVIVPSPDVGWLQGMKNTVSKIRQTLQSVQGLLDDLTAVVDEVSRGIKSFAGVIDDVRTGVDAFTNFIEGTKKFLDIPKAFLSATAGLLESTTRAAKSIASFPEDVVQAMRQLGDEWDRLTVAGRKHFTESFVDTGRRYESRTQGLREGEDPDRDAAAEALKAEAEAAQGRMSLERAFGQIRPGDVERARREPTKTRPSFRVDQYEGFQERVIGEGDTVQQLAAKYMGDARDAPLIVIANKLKAPYISEAKLPNVLTIGERVLIPQRSAASTVDTLSTGDPATGSSQAENQIGEDFELVKQADGTWAWAVDAAGGSTDARKVSGIPNLAQALGARLRTTQGDNALYPKVGLPNRIGSNGRRDDLVAIRYETRQQVLADSRVRSLSRYDFRVEQDRILIEIYLVPVGFSDERLIAQTLT
jgi:hypothetical protein